MMTKEYGVIKINLGPLERHETLRALIQFLVHACLFPTNICITIATFLLRKKR